MSNLWYTYRCINSPFYISVLYICIIVQNVLWLIGVKDHIILAIFKSALIMFVSNSHILIHVSMHIHNK